MHPLTAYRDRLQADRKWQREMRRRFRGTALESHAWYEPRHLLPLLLALTAFFAVGILGSAYYPDGTLSNPALASWRGAMFLPLLATAAYWIQHLGSLPRQLPGWRGSEKDIRVAVEDLTTVGNFAFGSFFRRPDGTILSVGRFWITDPTCDTRPLPSRGNSRGPLASVLRAFWAGIARGTPWAVPLPGKVEPDQGDQDAR